MQNILHKIFEVIIGSLICFVGNVCHNIILRILQATVLSIRDFNGQNSRVAFSAD